MSMRVSGGEESVAVSPGVPEEKACKLVSSVSSGEPEACLGAGMPDVVSHYPNSPLLGLLACRELLPQVLEHEKALLVMKEHDYAKAPHRAEVLQLSFSIETAREDGGATVEGEEGGEGDSTGLTNGSALLNCRNDLLKLRESMNSRCEPVVTSHFREVVGLQVALLREQQEQLFHKDGELNAIRKEKEQVREKREREKKAMNLLRGCP